MSTRLVVIGGDAAGGSAASQAKKRRPDLDVVLFERGRATSYSACGIPYWISGAVASETDLVARTPQQHRAAGLDVRMRTEVVGIDPDKGVVHWRDLDAGTEGTEPYDDLVYATGSVPMRPPVQGIDAQGVYGVQVLDDGVALRAELDRGHVRRVVVVGGGYIGLEIAEACRVRGLDVTVVDKSPQPVGTFDPDVGRYIADAVRSEGIELVLSDGVSGIDVGPDGRARAVVTESGRELPADLVVLGLGVRPNVRLAQEAGIPLGTSGGIAVDQRMRTEVPGVWAAGDCVESVHRLSKQRVVVALGTHANKQGRVAGINIGGGYATFPGVIGTAITKICAVEAARTGLSEREAEHAGYSFVTAAVDSTTKAGYFPGARPIRVKMIAERRSGRLLGAQVVGEEGAAKRVDALAICIWNEMTVDEVLSLDLSYAPPFAPVWDPVLIAARKAFEAVEADPR
ncbi:NADPH-dependent 2,4-dienoyl-CoA reductase/sulfur reductase-like enzyme [Geodermatophilus normandii]|uniref:NADPH-dependent 2,4-dienoyl-CoA reductase/sulfur reductase-like enzyme n=1 Tax=Geodermatophilus normandii TaxID=1137989 RepID=A0A317QKS4_9ACTN|nr:FAD-dependent oxidoreductase [Geodermatophilus normandii]PWW23982.1 NADPH-dependent 2,4-dienoyl-CoA reductase/sulfur reductase-like enzyme [Geodermatophilus normandii]